MRKVLIITSFIAAGLFGAVACSGSANADEPSDQTVIVNQSNSQTSGSTSCLPADVAARFPWLPVPVCS